MTGPACSRPKLRTGGRCCQFSALLGASGMLSGLSAPSGQGAPQPESDGVVHPTCQTAGCTTVRLGHAARSPPERTCRALPRPSCGSAHRRATAGAISGSGSGCFRGRPRGRFRATISPWTTSCPPHTPHGSRRSWALARHASWIGQLMHSDLAYSTSAGCSAKNTSGSTRWHGSSRTDPLFLPASNISANFSSERPGSALDYAEQHRSRSAGKHEGRESRFAWGSRP